MNIMEALKGFTETHLVYVGVQAGIFDSLGRSCAPPSASTLATDLGLHEKYLQIWLDTAVAFGYCTLSQSGTYTISAEAAPFVSDRSDPRYSAGLVELFIKHLSKDMLLQPEYMLTGKQYTFSDHEPEFVDLIAERGSLRGELFHSSVLLPNPRLAVPFHGDGYICDIGCGSGAFINVLQKYYPNPRFIGVDEDPQSIAEATRKHKSERVDFILSNITNHSFSKQFSCITMILCLHEIDAQDRPGVLKCCYDSLEENGQLLILEFPYPDRDDNFEDTKYTMGILDQYFEMTWGTEHMGWEAQCELISDAGFNDVEKLYLPETPYMLINAVKQ